VIICPQRGANDLHMVQLMPLPIHHILIHQNPDWSNLSAARLSRLSWKRGNYTGVVCYIRPRHTRWWFL